MQKRLLCAFAHPDDESFGPAGTILGVSRRPGGRVRLVIATRGEAGTIGISRNYPPGDLGRIRQWEMIGAAGVMNAELAFLGYPDRGVSSVDPGRASADLVREIRLFRPQVLLTFHPNGLSGHPDHMAMSRYLLEAWNLAPDPRFRPDLGAAWQPDRLYYYAISEGRARSIAHFRRVGSVPDEAIDVTLDVSAELAMKYAACQAHGTQLDFVRQLEQAVGGLDRYWSVEQHVLGAWHGGKPPLPHTGLFDGLT